TAHRVCSPVPSTRLSVTQKAKLNQLTTEQCRPPSPISHDPPSFQRSPGLCTRKICERLVNPLFIFHNLRVVAFSKSVRTMSATIQQKPKARPSRSTHDAPGDTEEISDGSWRARRDTRRRDDAQNGKDRTARMGGLAAQLGPLDRSPRGSL